MAIDDSSSSIFSPWPDRLRHSALILLAAALALSVVVALGELSLVRASAVFVCIAAAALVPWRLHDAGTSREDVRGVNPVEAAAVSAVVAGMPDPAVLLDRAGRVIHLNTAAAQLAPALRKNELAQFALRSPEIITALREAIATTEPRRATYTDHVPVDRWMELVITPVPVPTQFGGTEKCMLMTFHDLTPLRRVEEMRADFVANASHELRTPLAALSGFIDTLQGPAREDARARERFLGIMHTQATRMARLIDDLLSLSRVELSAHVRPEASIDVVPIIRQVADGLEALASERQVEIEVGLPQAPVMIAGDREELLRLFENLIENALKYGASGGRVIVSLNQAASGASGEGAPEIRVMVRDFGPGIAPEHLPRLTERFYRVDVGDSRNQGGTGLGLSLVKHILNRHRGRLLIESVPKNGATFTACFPRPKTPLPTQS
ncbi:MULTISPECIES: ATP-binding protein [Bradyrhizobium]|uniref:histidine kinase n=1 Tax=Bradyrhizobium elkanii TaxID=29448 RepID=A0A8I2C270_BRAEL|nr:MULTISPECIES: ATP-binding protein [Bradyrhizobium]MBP1291473.1 two-component system phosphate regulon sensor histidine kinase PhoR [Bradyrhizobium elkanii]MCP1928216.1 two-component system phosphate regulon sensor histidine kinase PhoR [Bradyrhizobium elkanii]MCS3474388.1 two-component system phosphate regulon sensor histidine kinase PhoR [Bradyrhizobium elkanii]MCS3581172.1 two-component system phosphate regulon sensor histidine kinase PhoR [Bradyrhizobium elkanii]MCS3724047.1 two-componen